MRLRARWGGAGGLPLLGVRVNLEVEGGGRCLGGVVTALLRGREERRRGCERQKRWREGRTDGWMDECTETEGNEASDVEDF